MKLVLVLLVFLGLGTPLYGQLTVKPTDKGSNTFLYVNNTVLYVDQEVNLQKNADETAPDASIYLRKEAQLIQGNVGPDNNSGNGQLSVFQEGTSNAYDYNYWSSPVNNGEEGRHTFGIGMLYRPLSQTKSERALSTTALDGTSNPLSISQRWIFTYSGTSYSDWYAVQDEPLIRSGYGFSMKGVGGTDLTFVDGRENNPGSAQRYDFRGLPNNGPIAISVQTDHNTLVGNPFPSAFDLSVFLLENSGTGSLFPSCGEPIIRKNAITGIAYFWDSVENGSSHYLEDYIGGYAAFSPVDPCTTGVYERPILKSYSKDSEDSGIMGKHYNRRFLPIGQGFMVKGTSDSQLVFRNKHRIYKKEGENSDFKQMKDDRKSRELLSIPKLRLQASINNNYIRSLSLALWPTATTGSDFGMDAQAFDLAPTDIGWNQNGVYFIIDVRPFDREMPIPLIVKVSDSKALFKIGMTEMEGIPIEDVFLLDKESNSYYSLVQGSFQISLDKGNYTDRFFLSFQPEETQEEPEPYITPFAINHNSKLDQIEVSNPNGISIQAIKVYDLIGREVYSSARNIGKFYSISTEYFATSVYIVKLITAGKTDIIVKVPVHHLE